jgi:hypothetical protein
MTAKQLLLVLLTSVACSTTIGFAFGQASNPQTADAAGSNRAVVSQLKQINKSVKSVDSGLGYPGQSNSVIGQLSILTRAVGTTTLGTSTVLGLLKMICGNTNASSPSGLCY